MKNRKLPICSLDSCFNWLDGLRAANKSSTDKNDGNTFKITTVQLVGLGEDYHKGFLDDSAKESGIKIKWDTMVAADWSDKKSVLVASGGLPDAFLDQCLHSSNCSEQNMFIPLEDLIKDNMPNWNAILEPKIKPW